MRRILALLALAVILPRSWAFAQSSEDEATLRRLTAEQVSWLVEAYHNVDVKPAN